MREVLMEQGVFGVITLALAGVIIFMYKQYTTALSRQADKCKECVEKSNKTAAELLAFNASAMAELRAEHQKNLADLYESMHNGNRQMCETMERMNDRVADAVNNLTAVVSKFSGMLDKLNGGK